MKIKRLTLGGVMAALVFVMTYFPKVPVPVTGGYIHLGDGAIFLAGMLLGPLAVASAAIGSALSDLVGGYVPYVLPTLVIKGLMALLVWLLYRPGKPLRQLVAFFLAEALMVVGYFLTEWALTGFPAALAAVMPNLIQGAAGIALGMFCVPLMPRMEKALR